MKEIPADDPLGNGLGEVRQHWSGRDVGAALIECGEQRGQPRRRRHFVVVERVPPSRATTKWLVRRSFRGGNGYVRCTLLLDRSVRARLIRAVKGAGQVLEGLLPLPLGVLRGQHVWMKHFLRLCFGLGSMAGVFGYFYHEYRRTAR